MLLNTSFRGSKITLAHSKLFKNLSFPKSLKTQKFQKVHFFKKPKLSTRKKSNLWHFYNHLIRITNFFFKLFRKLLLKGHCFSFKSHCESHKQNSIYWNIEWFKNRRLRRRRV